MACVTVTGLCIYYSLLFYITLEYLPSTYKKMFTVRQPAILCQRQLPVTVVMLVPCDVCKLSNGTFPTPYPKDALPLLKVTHDYIQDMMCTACISVSYGSARRVCLCITRASDLPSQIGIRQKGQRLQNVLFSFCGSLPTACLCLTSLVTQKD